MSHAIDGLLQWLKWPAALWFALSIPQLFMADLALVRNTLRADLAPFWLGLMAYLAVWWLVLRHRLWGQFLSTLLHELTHAIFAILTLHRVVALQATWSRGGELEFTGRGNWLIMIAPYFFPLAIVFAAPFLELVQTASPVRLAVLGVVFGFESAAMWRQVHRQQPDLHEVGYAFTAVFLPGALLWSFGTVLALALGGGRNMVTFVGTQWSEHWQLVGSLIDAAIQMII
ncbi:MAG: hypothetical protein CL927_09015 [Deltaproteobacteria bacterium]|nr:hypothetical protein [Deltaproteobacteria bacterium]HCH66893.1 hypothetical protein [Deltaproteobacteria bacterium]